MDVWQLYMASKTSCKHPHTVSMLVRWLNVQDLAHNKKNLEGGHSTRWKELWSPCTCNDGKWVHLASIPDSWILHSSCWRHIEYLAHSTLYNTKVFDSVHVLCVGGWDPILREYLLPMSWRLQLNRALVEHWSIAGHWTQFTTSFSYIVNLVVWCNVIGDPMLVNQTPFKRRRCWLKPWGR